MSHMLDTHIAVALFQGKTAGLSKRALIAIDRGSLLLSPIVLLELEMLYEIGRIRLGANSISQHLQRELDIRVSQDRLSEIVPHAIRFGFTRDPFDRMIVAHAAFNGTQLITQDALILANFAQAMD
jgi:PIN domain nuclease of toxin-antitoxin system